jgi:hypothetical protein
MWVYSEIAPLSELAIATVALMTIRLRRKRETAPVTGVHAAERWDGLALRDLARCTAVHRKLSDRCSKLFHPIERGLNPEPVGREAC